jgi:hypothetical protein
MPCMGPSRSISGQILDDLTNWLYKNINYFINNQFTNFYILNSVHKAIAMVVHHDYPANIGNKIDYIRQVYLVYGALQQLLPNEKIINIQSDGLVFTSNRINSDRWFSTEAEFKNWLDDLLYYLDCEDF